MKVSSVEDLVHLVRIKIKEFAVLETTSKDNYEAALEKVYFDFTKQLEEKL